MCYRHNTAIIVQFAITFHFIREKIMHEMYKYCVNKIAYKIIFCGLNLLTQLPNKVNAKS